MNNIGLIKKIALSVNTPPKPGIDFDDLLQEASIAYLKALKTYDKDRGGVTTHVWSCVRNHLRTYLKQEMLHRQPLQELETAIDCKSNPDFWTNLSEDAQKLLSSIMERSGQFINLKPKEAQKEIASDLKNRGWNPEKIEKGMRELSMLVSY